MVVLQQEHLGGFRLSWRGCAPSKRAGDGVRMQSALVVNTLPEPSDLRTAVQRLELAVATGAPGDAPVAEPRRRDPGAFLSPAVRSFLSEHAVDPREIAGSGRDGRISLDDLRARDREGLESGG